MYLQPGDTVRLLLFCRRTDHLPINHDLIWARTTLQVNFSAYSFACTAFDGPQLLEPAKCLPPLSQKDFVKDFLLRTNSVLELDPQRRTATVYYREDHVQAQGPAVELSAYAHPDDVQHLPPVGGAGRLVFRPADASGDTLAPADKRVVVLPGGDAQREQAVEGFFAATGLRTYRLPDGSSAAIPTVASAEALALPLSESSPGADAASHAPHVVRYTGPGSAEIEFQQRSLAYGQAEYAGALAWAGAQGAVAVRYATTVRQAQRGEAARVQLPLRPDQYRQLTPGRRVWLHGAEYQVETKSGWDVTDEAATAQIDLLRRV